jgi:hypothetical protein
MIAVSICPSLYPNNKSSAVEEMFIKLVLEKLQKKILGYFSFYFVVIQCSWKLCMKTTYVHFYGTL